jgi:hypothetical protein
MWVPGQSLGRIVRSRTWRYVRWIAIGAGLIVGIQFVPYGWSHPNPPVTQDAPWPDAESERIARSSCYACHSNETGWPAYSYVAPMSWLVRSDVEDGREQLNFSTWDREAGEFDDAVEVIADGSMPPDRHTLIHRDATLTDAEVDRLTAALAAANGFHHRSVDQTAARHRRRSRSEPHSSDRTSLLESGPPGFHPHIVVHNRYQVTRGRLRCRPVRPEAAGG